MRIDRYVEGVHRLTDRELVILKFASDGMSKEQIAEWLGISTHTVRTHRANIHRKLGTKTWHGAVAQAMRAGILP